MVPCSNLFFAGGHVRVVCSLWLSSSLSFARSVLIYLGGKSQPLFRGFHRSCNGWMNVLYVLCAAARSSWRKISTCATWLAAGRTFWQSILQPIANTVTIGDELKLSSARHVNNNVTRAHLLSE
ncbi:unnamed protein product [Periconia digitata]|uniref:Uncharacterized protein n=1 Tax=Periconia digitata TaxID=1303443 RepID=A0A9W4UJ95_9PLEO|nr:unnamed protein product [Periconia digitata]